MFLAHAFQSGLERDFVVVQWDRRGAGKSFDARLQTPVFSVSQTLEDTWELTRRLRARFAQQRIYLVGHSWGSYLGLLAIRGHPEYYRAFIGTGQLAGTREQIRALRRELLSRAANRSRDPKLLARLASPNLDVSEDDLFRLGGELHRSRSYWPILRTGLVAPEYTLRDALNVKRGADLVAREMKYDVAPTPLGGEIPKVNVPVFFFVGRHDFNTPSQLASEYLERLETPLKGLVWFEHSAHFPFFEEPDLFHREMVQVQQAVSAFWKERTGNHSVAQTLERQAFTAGAGLRRTPRQLRPASGATAEVSASESAPAVRLGARRAVEVERRGLDRPLRGATGAATRAPGSWNPDRAHSRSPACARNPASRRSTSGRGVGVNRALHVLLGYGAAIALGEQAPYRKAGLGPANL